MSNTNNLDDRIQQDLRPEDIEEEFDALPEETKQKFYDLVSNTLEGFLWCNRVWEAWYAGTMSENDFIPAGDDPDVIYGYAVAAYKLFKELKSEII